MNSSLFSSFDAVCAEFLGHRVSASMPCTSPLCPKPQEEIMNSSSLPTQISEAATHQPIITPPKSSNAKLNCCRVCS